MLAAFPFQASRVGDTQNHPTKTGGTCLLRDWNSPWKIIILTFSDWFNYYDQSWYEWKELEGLKTRGKKTFSDSDVTPRTWKFWKSVLQWMDNRDPLSIFKYLSLDYKGLKWALLQLSWKHTIFFFSLEEMNSYLLPVETNTGPVFG